MLTLVGTVEHKINVLMYGTDELFNAFCDLKERITALEQLDIAIQNELRTYGLVNEQGAICQETSKEIDKLDDIFKEHAA